MEFSFDVASCVALVAAFVSWLIARHTDKQKQSKALMNFVCMDWNTMDDDIAPETRKNNSKYIVTVTNLSQKILRDFELTASCPKDNVRTMQIFIPFLRPGEYFIESKYQSDQTPFILEDMDKLHTQGVYYHPMISIKSKSAANGYRIQASCMDDNGKKWFYDSDNLVTGTGVRKYMWKKQ